MSDSTRPASVILEPGEWIYNQVFDLFKRICEKNAKNSCNHFQNMLLYLGTKDVRS
jgi:hypothetical protein